MTITKEYIIDQIDTISKKYEDWLVTPRRMDCLYCDLFNLYKNVEIFLGKNLARKLFKECLIEYCGFALGVTLFNNLREEYEKGV